VGSSELVGGVASLIGASSVGWLTCFKLVSQTEAHKLLDTDLTVALLVSPKKRSLIPSLNAVRSRGERYEYHDPRSQ
jgi:hypothetical protein